MRKNKRIPLIVVILVIIVIIFGISKFLKNKNYAKNYKREFATS